MGIAQRILYLHKDSRLKIIHIGLKASNVLLDAEMLQMEEIKWKETQVEWWNIVRVMFEMRKKHIS